jgi:hypothetical protein
MYVSHSGSTYSYHDNIELILDIIFCISPRRDEIWTMAALRQFPYK